MLVFKRVARANSGEKDYVYAMFLIDEKVLDLLPPQFALLISPLPLSSSNGKRERSLFPGN